MNHPRSNNHDDDMEQENWMGLYRRWSNQDERQLIKLYDAEKSIDDIARELGRESVEVILRLLELRILDTEAVAKIWDDYSEAAKAA